MTPTRLLTPLIALLCCMTHFAVAAGETPDEVKRQTVSLIPTVRATVRARFEASTVESLYRFQVRNARISIGGKIIPQIEYFVNTDFCDRGKIKFLDAWARAYITGGLDLRGGQFRMPFGVDIHRGPDNYYFSNRSFIGRQMANFRAVGAELRYSFKTAPRVIGDEQAVFVAPAVAVGGHAVEAGLYGELIEVACAHGHSVVAEDVPSVTGTVGVAGVMFPDILAFDAPTA